MDNINKIINQIWSNNMSLTDLSKIAGLTMRLYPQDILHKIKISMDNMF